MKQGLKVAYFSLEMSPNELRKRFMSNMLNIKMDNLNPSLNYDDFKKQFEVFMQLYDGLFECVQFPAKITTALQMEAHLNTLKTKKNFVPDVIMVDYLGITGSYTSRKTTSEHGVLDNVATELRNLMLKFNAIGWTGLQINRSSADPNNITDVSIAGAYSIKNHVDYLVSAFYDKNVSDQIGKGCLTFKTLKSRYSGLHTSEMFHLGVDYSHQRIYELDSDAIPHNNENIKINLNSNKKQKSNKITVQANTKIDFS
jgi:hypothetical protein